ncbi:abc transporter c family member 10 [Fagus crenata]
MNYVTVDAYRIGEFPYWFHQIWSTTLQLCLALIIVWYSVGLATVAALIVIILIMVATSPLAKLQHKYQTKLMVAQDNRLKAITEALANMKVLKLYAWEKHFKNAIEGLRKEEPEWILAVLSQKGYYLILFWSFPILVSIATFWSCYFLGIPLSTSNVFMFLASLRIVQEPIRMIPDVAGVFIEAKVSLTRIVKFLEAPELENRNTRQNCNEKEVEQSIFIKATEISWETNPANATLRNINLEVKQGEKVAICGEVGSGLIGMALSYGLSINVHVVYAIENWCMLENLITSVERLEQYMHIPSEAAEVIESHQPMQNWPVVGEVKIYDLKIRYRPNAPLVLQGISCIFEGGHKIGIVGRTGSGKTTLISALFRLVEPTEGMIIIDGIDISKIGLHDLRSRLGIIPQDATLFSGSVRYNLDPQSEHTDQEIWEAIREKEEGLDSLVMQDGSNWSLGQRQLFCLGRALLKRSQILMLDEATASIDNATDSLIQKTIRTEFTSCTVITVAHRIPTVMDCTKVLAISDGKMVEYDEPLKLMNKEGSLFGQLVREYWSHSAS